MYLTTVLDLYRRDVIGWAMRTDLASAGPVAALRMAAVTVKPQAGLIVHSDRGVQFASQEFRSALQQLGSPVQQSMSRKGNCWDNACAESFFSTLKRELPEARGGFSSKTVKLAVFSYIETYYNRLRRRAILGYRRPMDVPSTVSQ